MYEFDTAKYSSKDPVMYDFNTAKYSNMYE